LNNIIRSTRITQPCDERNKLDQKWKMFTDKAKELDEDFIEPVVPFNDDIVLSDFNKIYKSISDKERYYYS
jgi:hypothetical protein